MEGKTKQNLFRKKSKNHTKKMRETDKSVLRDSLERKQTKTSFFITSFFSQKQQSPLDICHVG